MQPGFILQWLVKVGSKESGVMNIVHQCVLSGPRHQPNVSLDPVTSPCFIASGGVKISQSTEQVQYALPRFRIKQLQGVINHQTVETAVHLSKVGGENRNSSSWAGNR